MKMDFNLAVMYAELAKTARANAEQYKKQGHKQDAKRCELRARKYEKKLRDHATECELA